MTETRHEHRKLFSSFCMFFLLILILFNLIFNGGIIMIHNVYQMKLTDLSLQVQSFWQHVRSYNHHPNKDPGCFQHLGSSLNILWGSECQSTAHWELNPANNSGSEEARRKSVPGKPWIDGSLLRHPELLRHGWKVVTWFALIFKGIIWTAELSRDGWKGKEQDGSRSTGQ